MILIALGANLPGPGGETPRETCEAALSAVFDRQGGRLLTAASDGVARLWGPGVDPAALLAAVLAIEDRHGRHRTGPNAARSLDLDLIDVNGLVRARPDPVLPHPRAHRRAFVLVPLLDVRDRLAGGAGRDGGAAVGGQCVSGRSWTREVHAAPLS